MRNISGKSCKANQNTHFMFNNIFPKMVPFMRKIWYSRTGHRWQYLYNRGQRFACWI